MYVITDADSLEMLIDGWMAIDIQTCSIQKSIFSTEAIRNSILTARFVKYVTLKYTHAHFVGCLCNHFSQPADILTETLYDMLYCRVWFQSHRQNFLFDDFLCLNRMNRMEAEYSLVTFVHCFSSLISFIYWKKWGTLYPKYFLSKLNRKVKDICPISKQSFVYALKDALF